MVPRPGSPGEGTPYQVTTDWPANGFALDPSTEEVYEAVGNPRRRSGTARHADRSLQRGLQSGQRSLRTDSTPSAKATSRKARKSAFRAATAIPSRANSTSRAWRWTAPPTPCMRSTQNPAGGGCGLRRRPADRHDRGTDRTWKRPVSRSQGSVDPAGRGAITDCRLRIRVRQEIWPLGSLHARPGSNPPGSNFTTPTAVTASISGLSPGTHEHYRLVATNAAGATTNGADRIFITTAPPPSTDWSPNTSPRRQPNSMRTGQSKRPPDHLSLPVRTDASPTDRKSRARIEASNIDQEINGAAHGTDSGRLPLPSRCRKQGRRQGRRRDDDHRRPRLQLLPALLPERKRPPADRGKLPARLPRLRAGLARRRQRHPALRRRARTPASRRARRDSHTRASGRRSRIQAEARSTRTAISMSRPGAPRAG